MRRHRRARVGGLDRETQNCAAEVGRGKCVALFQVAREAERWLGHLQWSVLGVSSLALLLQQACLLVALLRLSPLRCASSRFGYLSPY